jgi:1-deoxy-D-xylulose-5-phosphate synthase
MLSALLKRAFSLGRGPVVLRYPRGVEPGGLPGPDGEVEPGRGQVLRDGPDVLVIACGVMAGPAMEAAGLLAGEGTGVCVFDPVWLKPAPWDDIESLAAGRRGVVVVEDGSAAGGFGEGVALRLAETGTPVRALGYPDMFQPQGPREGLLAGAGLDADGIARAVRGILA